MYPVDGNHRDSFPAEIDPFYFPEKSWNQKQLGWPFDKHDLAREEEIGLRGVEVPFQIQDLRRFQSRVVGRYRRCNCRRARLRQDHV